MKPGSRGPTAREMEPLLLLSDVSVTYPQPHGAAQGGSAEGLRAVDGVSLKVWEGELVALVGESGCGKTTVARAALRLGVPVDGSVKLDGVEISGLSRRRLRALRRSMQMVFQDPYESLDPRFTVKRTLEEPLRINRIVRSRERTSRCLSAMERVGLTPGELYLNRYGHELSGGQRQRLAIAASLVTSPRLLVADEPVSMLDVSVRIGVLKLLNDLRKTEKLAILMITHDLATAASFADRIAVMYAGRVVEEGPSHDVVSAPQHPYTKALVAVVPSCDRSETDERRILEGEPPNLRRLPSGCRFSPRCPIAQKECSQQDPELRQVGPEPGRHVACLLSQ